MKKLILSFAIALLPTLMFSQAIFDKFDGKDDVVSLIVGPKLFQMMGNVKMDSKDKNDQLYLNLVKKLDNLRVFTTASTAIGSDMKATAEKYSKTAGLEELMRVNDSGKSIKILVKSGSNSSKIKELLMFIEGSGKANQSVLMSLTGDFDLDEISVLTDKMKFPGGDALKKAAKSKK